jgi:hypothetical protein
MKAMSCGRALRRFLLPLVVWLSLAACGGGGGGGSNPLAAAAQNLNISGKLVAPDGSTPVANALVYVEGSSAPDAQAQQVRAAAADLPCGAPPNPAWPATCTAPDGSFGLTTKAPDNAKLIAVKGAFRLEQTLSAANNGVLSLGAVALSSGDAAAPKMAVVTGRYDSIENILARLGYGEVDEGGVLRAGTEKFKIYDGNPPERSSTYPPLTALFEDADNSGKADIFDFNIVFFNCGLDEASIATLANRDILRAYVQGGGRIYASDLAYDIVEQVFPEYIDFFGDDAVPATEAETPGAAELGLGGITVNATLDPTLMAWLRGVTCAGGSCVQADDTVKIDGFLDGWAVINGAHSGAIVRQWAQGPVAHAEVTGTVNKPLTMSFSAGAGRVTFTSYHNEAAVGGELQPQQRILQYLVFEL